MKLPGKKILVTGGATGYGYGMAAALKAQGAEVWITGRREERLRQAAAALEVNWMRADITVGADWDRVLAAMKGLDVLINNAGAGIKVEPLTEFTDAEVRQSIDGNLTGTILGCRRAAAIMQQQRAGLIINVSSICAHYGWPGFACYTAAKAGLDKFSRALFTELRPANVRVTVLTPSWGATEFGTAAKLPAPEAELAAQMMSPEQMGELVVQICMLPDHLVFPEIMVQPVVQEIIPF